MFDQNSEPPTTGRMTNLFLRLAVPASLTNILAYVCPLVNTLFAGHMNDTNKLAAVGLAGVTLHLMVMSFLIGLNSAQDTLTSQAFGHGNIRLVGVYLNRGRLILTAAFIPMAIIPGYFSEEILVALG